MGKKRPQYFERSSVGYPGKPFRISGVLFDFDGTLTKPGALDFEAIRRAVECPPGVGLLEYLRSLPDGEERRQKEAILEDAENEAAGRACPNEGAEELVAFLRTEKVPLAIITRNRRVSVEQSLAGFATVSLADFAVVVGRDLSLPPKPSPEGVQYVAEQLGVKVQELLVIGDHWFDIEAGRRAGALTMFLASDSQEVAGEVAPDFIVSNLYEAARVIRYGLPLPAGKLPAEYLAEGLAGMGGKDPAVLIGAAVGEDAAALQISEGEVLVVSCDPITLTAASLASHAVVVNANDIATSGAIPRWFFTTLLFPPGVSPAEVLALLADLQACCSAQGVTLCGGHTEVTSAVTRPVVAGTMAGTTSVAGLMDKAKMGSGDCLLLTKGVAVEGTGLLAREQADELAKAGFSPAEIERCAAFLEQLSIVEEARVCWGWPGVSALHDVTEGGLATAVAEMAQAGGCRLRVRMERIPIYPETQRVCSVWGLDPLGLIGSGSLLVTCGAATAPELVRAIGDRGIAATVIGEVLGPGEGVEALRDGLLVEWPRFERDEILRLAQ